MQQYCIWRFTGIKCWFDGC